VYHGSHYGKPTCIFPVVLKIFPFGFQPTIDRFCRAFRDSPNLAETKRAVYATFFAQFSGGALLNNFVCSDFRPSSFSA
jgi:hypothetical protein